jgi:hypothetical protein
MAARVVERPDFDERFDRLFESAGGVRDVIGIRDSAFLRWRHGRDPEAPPSAILAEDGEGLAGYLIFTFDAGVVRVRDALARGGPETYDDLFQALLAEAGRLAAGSVSIVLLEGHPLLPLVHDHGFVRRDSRAEVYLYAAPRDALRPVLYDPASWFLTVGDRDV